MRYADADGDEHGDASRPLACAQQNLVSSTDADDCDDQDATVHPDVDESDTPCDGIDNDCDGAIDGGLRVPEDYALPSAAMAAAEDGDTVCVGPGNYVDRLHFYHTNLQVIGVAGAAATVIDGAGSGSVVFADLASSATLRGFTITGGLAEVGAGIYVRGPAVTLEDLIVTDNTCVAVRCEGTGIHAESWAGAISIRRTQVINNSTVGASVGGGAIFLYGDAELTDVDVLDNKVSLATDPEGLVPEGFYGIVRLSGPISMTRVTIAGNHVSAPHGSASLSADGVGAYLVGAQAVLQNVTIADNVATNTNAGGVGIYVDQYSRGTFTNVVIAGNRVDAAPALGRGAGALILGEATFTNVDIVGNAVEAEFAAHDGGLYSFDAVLTNVSIADNVVSSPGTAQAGAMSVFPEVVIRYSSFSNNGSDPFDGYPSPVGSNGNIEGTPDYLNLTNASAAAWDLTLGPSSTLRDAGDPAILDADGTRSDIGSRGGPLGLDW